MNYYEILEVSEKASDEVIKMAYKALVKKYHPDTFNGDPKIAEEKMKEINAAYFILSNTEKRREYDAFLHFQRNQTNQNNYTTQTNSNRTQAPSSPNKSAANFDTLIARITPIIFILAIPLAYNFFASYYALPPLFSPTPTPSPTPTYVAPNPPLPSNLIPDYNIVVNESDGLDFFEKVELRKAELIKEGNYKLPAEMVQPFSNGQMIITPTENCVCPLSVSVSGDDAYYIYLESLSGKSDLAFMIKPDSMVEIDVPLGKFKMYYATGKSWYGTTLKFGDETRYYKAGTTLEFTRDGQYYYGHEIELWEQYDGNMTEIDIKESDFPG